ncbi:MAG TPA: hypothetical protein PLP14_08265, partial [Chitinophagaceae bacterium]|nr:hypothetical protein [Chitinophagaceae bacterium]
MKQQLHHRGYLTGIRTLLLLCIGLTSAVWTGQAQTPMFFNGNTGASSNAFPLNSGTSNKVQWIYAPGTFNSNGSTGTPAFAGNITKVWFRLSATTATYANFTISLGQNVGAIANYGTTTASGVAFNTGLTTCFYQASYPLTTVAGWNGFTLQTPFPYNPALALIIELKVSSTVGASSLQLNTTGSMQRLYAGYAATTGTINTGLVNAGIDVIVSTPCVAPPTPGTVTVSPSTPFCLGGSASLTLTGNSSGSGQTYQWESSSVSGGPYTDIAGATTTATTVSPSATSYYRCKVTCSGNTVPTPEATVSVNPPFPGGNYTINSALPTGGTNFQSFSAAVAAMSCGISSSIVFDVVPGSGPYNEQISLPASIGSNATKTVTFNGNGNTIQFASADAANKHVIRLDGADYVTFDNLNIIGSGGTYGWGIHLMNGADYNTFSLCNVNVSITDATAYNHVALVVANSTSSPIT